MSYPQQTRYNKASYGFGHENRLVATILPEGKKLFSLAGVSNDKARLLAFARGCRGCPDKIEAVGAESVGLEWHNHGGKLAWGDRYRVGLWVLLCDAERPEAAVDETGQGS